MRNGGKLYSGISGKVCSGTLVNFAPEYALIEHGYVRFENYFCDGSTFEADANRHKMVWNKNAKRYQAATEQKCRELFKQIDQLNETEQHQYGNRDLEESGTDKQAVTKEQIAVQTDKLEKVIATTTSKRL